MTTSVTIDRSSLSKAALVIETEPADSTYLLVVDGLTEPAMTWRLTAMPDSVDVHGSEYIAAVREQTSLPLKIEVQAASAAALQTALNDLDEALSQFSYPVTVTIDGVAKTWSAAPGSWATEPTNRKFVLGHYRLVTMTLPVYPIPGA